MSLQSASLEQLEAACPGASEGFLLAQLKAGVSAEAAATANGAQLAAQLKAANQQIGALQQQLTQAQATNNPSARERELQSQLDFATKSRGQHAPLRERPGSGSGGASAKAQANELIQQAMAGGLNRQKAHAKVMRENPDLRQAIVAEANAG